MPVKEGSPKQPSSGPVRFIDARVDPCWPVRFTVWSRPKRLGSFRTMVSVLLVTLLRRNHVGQDPGLEESGCGNLATQRQFPIPSAHWSECKERTH